MKLRVNSLTGRTFRRNGIGFTGAPVVIDTDALNWTPQQLAELFAATEGKGAALHVENLDAPPPAPVADPEPTPAPTRSRGR